MSQVQVKPSADSLADYLHLFVLVSFAFAQPLYDILGQNPEFFVAHQASATQIIGAILMLSIGIAVIFVLIELIARIFGKKFRSIVHRVLIFLLVTLIIASPVKRWAEGNDIFMMGFVLTTSFVITLLYVRINIVRVFISMLSPAIIFFPLWFVWGTPVERLILPQTMEASSDIYIENKVPIVVVVLDEFTTTALLDSNGEIDSVRFPNFSAFSKESWWYPNAVSASQSTVEAVPVILTGRNPRPKERLTPIATDYPYNLFTMLEREYPINVFESATSFVPKDNMLEIVGAGNSRYVELFSDMAMIYLHLVVPMNVATKLPSLEAGWTGFGQNILQANKSDPVILHIDLTKKDKQLDQFLSQIKASAHPELYFIHTLLPHIPYHYLASGKVYSRDLKLPEGIISDRDGWLGEESLILTAYNRFLQQVGYVDTFLGRLKKQLISAGIYDKSLVLITADHGVAFKTMKSRRLINKANASEILKIPMFIKLPGQRDGHIDNKIVSSIDVLPTIVDVLGVKLPWKFDGASMFSDDQPLRTGIEFVGFGHFNTDDIIGFSRLKWQIENFGEHTPFNRLIPKGPYHELANRDIENLEVSEMDSVLLKSNDINNYQHVDLESDFLPSLFRGYIIGSADQRLPLAITVNGKIWATIKTSNWDGRKNYFSVLLPQEAFVQGRNIVNVYLIEQSGNNPLLRSIKKDDHLYVSSNRKQLGTEISPHLGAYILTLADGREIPLETQRKNIDGYLDWLVLKDGMLIFQGWAADLVEGQPVSNILIFRGGEVVWQVAPDYEREGVAKAFNQPALLRSGYRAIVPLNAFEPHSGDISVIAISKDKRAFRLYIKDEHKELIRTALTK